MSGKALTKNDLVAKLDSLGYVAKVPVIKILKAKFEAAIAKVEAGEEPGDEFMKKTDTTGAVVAPSVVAPSVVAPSVVAPSVVAEQPKPVVPSNTDSKVEHTVASAPKTVKKTKEVRVENPVPLQEVCTVKTEEKLPAPKSRVDSGWICIHTDDFSEVLKRIGLTDSQITDARNEVASFISSTKKKNEIIEKMQTDISRVTNTNQEITEADYRIFSKNYSPAHSVDELVKLTNLPKSKIIHCMLNNVKYSQKYGK